MTDPVCHAVLLGDFGGGARYTAFGLAPVRENLSHRRGLLDQRDHARRPFAFWAFEQIGFVDLPNEPR